jgi:hypothetical protein
MEEHKGRMEGVQIPVKVYLDIFKAPILRAWQSPVR